MKKFIYNSYIQKDIKGRSILNPLSGEYEFLEEVDVCIFTEGTYPFVKGGVSSVIHQTIENLPEKTFGIVYIGWDKNFDFKNLYPELKQLRWIFPILLSDIKPQSFFEEILNHFKWSAKLDVDFSDLIHRFKVAFNRNYADLIELYNDYLNPLTRKVDVKGVLEDKHFFNFLINEFSDMEISLNDFFWMKKEFVTLSMAILDKVYPLGKVYHSHSSGYAGLAASVASVQNDVKFLLTEHSLYTRDVLEGIDKVFTLPKEEHLKDQFGTLKNNFKKNIWKNWFEEIGRINYSRCSVSSYLYRGISQDALKLGAMPKKITIIPNGVNFEKFEEVRKLQKIRHQDRFQSRKYQWTLGFIGRIVPVKGVLDLIDSISILKNDFPHIKFKVDLIGPTNEDEGYFLQCQKHCLELGLNEIICFKGMQNIFECLPQIDLLLLSSKSEAFPMAVLEGMAASIPIVSTNVGSVEYILDDDLKGQCQIIKKAGEVVLVGDHHAFANAIVNVLESRNDYEEYQTNGPLRIQNFFQLNKVIGRYNEFYDKLRSS